MNLYKIYSKTSDKISLTKCVMSELRGPEFKFYLNNQVQIIELVVTDCNFERFSKYLSNARFNNKIKELSISIGNPTYLKPFLDLLMGYTKEDCETAL